MCLAMSRFYNGRPQVRMTLPLAKARGFSAERQDAERLAGCPPERAGVRMDGQPTCDWSGPRLFDPLAACPADRREPSLGTMRPKALARRPPHTGSAPVPLPPAAHGRSTSVTG